LDDGANEMAVAMEALFESNLKSLELIARGKVRDIYRVDAKRLLILATDRMSAFDVVLPDPIPGKGAVLTAISNFWFAKLANVLPNHLTGVDPMSVLGDARDEAEVKGRSVVVHDLKALPIEAVVRGYLIGSGWKDYCKNGRVSGVALPPGLELAEQLREPIFTPSTKAARGAQPARHGARTQGQREVARAVRSRYRLRARARHHHRRHQIRIRPRRER
jgi:phosphoribosylaminoimidazole-succinocarboxamide synthase